MSELIVTEAGETFDNLILGTSIPILTENVIVVAGAGALNRGTILGKVTASNKYNICDSTKTDGTQTAVCILSESITATTDTVATVYRTGQFNRGKLIVAATDTVLNHEEELRKNSIFLTKMEG